MEQLNNEAMKIIFFGASKFVLPILESITPSLIITTEKQEKEPVISFAKDHNIPFLSIKQWNNETIATIKSIRAPIAVLAFFGLILPKEVLDLFPKGILNVHPSLLPRYRGPTPVQTAIINGDRETGVTLIRLDEEVDHGSILAQEKEPILSTDTTETLHTRLFVKGAQLLALMIRIIKANGPIEERHQDHTKATFTNHLTRQDGYFDISNPPSPKKLDRMIRAFYPWPNVWTLLRLRASEGQAKEKMVKFIPGKKLQVEGGKPMSLKDFLNGYPELRELLISKLKITP